MTEQAEHLFAKMKTTLSKGRPWVTGVLCLGAVATVVSGDERRFTYVYEVTTIPKGTLEYEQWVTWKTAKETNRDFDRFDFRHEIEYGVTDKFQLALYLADWRYEESPGKHQGDFRDIALEGIYNLTNPVTDPLGVWPDPDQSMIGRFATVHRQKCRTEKHYQKFLALPAISLQQFL